MSERIHVPIDSLRPIQATLGFDPVLERDSVTNTPITTLLYKGELRNPEAEYLILDGHHRVRLAHYLGAATIDSIVFTTDLDISSSELPSLRWCGGTIEGAKGVYMEEWLPRLSSRGVTDISSLTFG